MTAATSIKKFLPPLTLVAILLVSFALMWSAAEGESAIMDELAHIPAGFGYVKYFDYRLNPEHPPLVKALSAIPLLPLDLKFPTDHTSWTKDLNGQWEAGTQFLYKYGNDAEEILNRARIAPILLTLLTTLLIYLWSREILGKSWALIPTLLFGFSPTVLAHGHYVTTDIAATLGVILATYFFLKFLARNTSASIILAGVALGVAELAKFSSVLLLPYFLILLVIYNTLLTPKFRHLFKQLKSFFLIILIAYIIVYAVYFVFTFNYPQEKQLADATEILASFSPRWLAELDFSFIKNDLTRPIGEYLLGLLMVLQRSAGGNTGYFLGEVSAAGWWFYFPLVFLMKEPLPGLLLIGLAISISLKNIAASFWISGALQSRWKRFRDYLALHFEEFAMLLFIIIYWGYSVRSPLNIGVRHLLPTIPFIYILSVAGLKRWIQTDFETPENVLGKLLGALKEVMKRSVKMVIAAALIVWFLGETVTAFPYFLSYFNQFAGGIKDGYRYVTDSNYDWGQDLKRLAAFVRERNNDDDHNNDIQKIAVDYFGGGNPKYYLGENVAELWSSARGNPKEEEIEWLAVSVNTLESAFGKLHAGQERKPEDEYDWLRALRPPKEGLGYLPEPDYRAGTSILIYRL